LPNATLDHAASHLLILVVGLVVGHVVGHVVGLVVGHVPKVQGNTRHLLFADVGAGAGAGAGTNLME